MRTAARRLVLALGLLAGLAGPGWGAARLEPRLARACSGLGADAELLVWVSFVERGAGGAGAAAPRLDLVSERSLRRRAKLRPAGALVDDGDRPLDPAHVEAVMPHVVRLRQRSRWLNAVSAVVTVRQIAALQRLPVVRSLDLVARAPRGAPPPAEVAPGKPPAATPQAAAFDYGPSFTQVQMLNVPALHDSGLTGRGVLIAHLDDGYTSLGHAAFESLHVVARRDFVGGDGDPVLGTPGWGAHGMQTLSALAGFAPGSLIGPAFGADFALARTEDQASETPAEEDRWIAAVEWADSLGADLVSSSVGYDAFPGYPGQGYTWGDMDGDTARVTRAADLAAARGMLVVNAAGNGGGSAAYPVNTLLAPADGDSVLAVGAVQSNGVRYGSSSIGPTAGPEPRLKPDVMAMGAAVVVVHATEPAGYTTNSGTSFSCPLVAGVAALVLSARPDLGPMDLVEALRSTATRAHAPDKLYGWGTVDGLRAWRGLAPPPPTAFHLDASYPNPFNAGTTIRYELAQPSRVTLRLYDVRGRLVRTLLHDAAQDAAEQRIDWDGTAEDGRKLPSGVYLVRLRAAGQAGVEVPVFIATGKTVRIE
jgi:subtilisin family serine protease